MKKISVLIVLSVLTLLVSACAPKVPVACGEGIIEVPLRKVEDYKSACQPMTPETKSEGNTNPVGNPEDEVSEDNEDEVAVEQPKGELAHLAYWTTATEDEKWPDMGQFNIVACHSDPDGQGNAKVVFLIGDIKISDLQLTYFNGYTGEWNDAAKSQIITEIEDSVRPHVPGFTLSEVEIIHINN